ncbi:PP0621 family protein [Massilia sp. R2A-15]|uniref:PP0621 family protein n=1 Tax=Massilia sp. R2A-15 TaxID=3064278 RepID=UPI0027376D06|nr:PP0621 family protein [Massilia sp. R2A-15]WLI88428.1 PP0621 family protein [Massilia sp. R2A-15]
MSRLLFWLALAVLVVFAIRSKLRASGLKPPRDSRADYIPREGASEPMACCAHCGVYFPASEAVHADGRDYCSPAHVRLPSK